MTKGKKCSVKFVCPRCKRTVPQRSMPEVEAWLGDLNAAVTEEQPRRPARDFRRAFAEMESLKSQEEILRRV